MSTIVNQFTFALHSACYSSVVGTFGAEKNMREIWLITASLVWTIAMGGALLVMIVMY
jgi:hypothetical protein